MVCACLCHVCKATKILFVVLHWIREDELLISTYLYISEQHIKVLFFQTATEKKTTKDRLKHRSTQQ